MASEETAGLDAAATITDDGLALLERVSAPPARGAPELLDARELAARLGLESEYLAGRLLAQLADGSVISREALTAKLRALLEGPPRPRLRVAFGMHDHDGNGRIERSELLFMLHLSLAESRIVFGEDMVELLADALFDRADTDGDGSIDFEEFERALEAYPGVHGHLALGDLAWLGLAPPPPPPRPRTLREQYARLRAARSRLTTFALFLGYVGLSLGLFIEAVLRYGEAGAPLLVQIARGCGAALNLHGALVLIPMCRRTLTLLGRTRLGRVLIDDHVSFHRVVGMAALGLGVAHGVAHGLNAWGAPAGLTGLVSWAGITGLALLLLHLLIATFARDAVRRSGRFELFFRTHQLYPVWIALMLAHGPAAWMWMGAPLALFVVDRFIARRAHRTIATGVEVLASGVTRLTIVPPRDFDAEAGDYVFLRVPALAPGEWHPFTISSAPERKDALTLHVRSAGNWTSSLHKMAQERPDDAGPLEVWLEGPFGTPSASVMESKHVLLVAAGIGVTPFASVLASMRARLARDRELPVRTVTFVWVCGEQRSFEWFSDELGRLERADPTRFDVRIFLTAGRSDRKSAVLAVAMDALYATVQADLVTGLRARTSLGAPDWDALLAAEVARHGALEEGEEGVDCFYCGPDGLARLVEAACVRHGVPFRQEHF